MPAQRYSAVRHDAKCRAPCSWLVADLPHATASDDSEHHAILSVFATNKLQADTFKVVSNNGNINILLNDDNKTTKLLIG